MWASNAVTPAFASWYSFLFRTNDRLWTLRSTSILMISWSAKASTTIINQNKLLECKVINSYCLRLTANSVGKTEYASTVKSLYRKRCTHLLAKETGASLFICAFSVNNSGSQTFPPIPRNSSTSTHVSRLILVSRQLKSTAMMRFT